MRATGFPPRELLLDLLQREPEEVYHQRRADNLSSHALADFRRCPQLFRRKELGLIPQGDSPAMRFGRPAHCRILEGAAEYEARYAIGGPINPRTGRAFGADTKAFADWAESQGRPVVSIEQASLIEQMSAAVAGHVLASGLLSAGIPEGVVRAEYGDTPCQIRIDWTHPEQGIVDLKTIDDIDWFEAQSRSYGYAHQLAFYRAVLAVASGRKVAVHVIAVEKREPFRVGVWRYSDHVLDAAAADNLAAIERLRWCRAAGTWVTGYEGLRFIESN